MFRVRLTAVLLALCLALGVGGSVLAAQVDSDATYCFTAQDFSSKEERITGICITGLPEEGAVYLGNRLLKPGDILTADQVEKMTFSPVRTQEDKIAQVTYLPIYENRVEKNAVMTISIRGKEDKVPAAEDSLLETYKNLPVEGKLKAEDPEGEKLTYTLVRGPKRGELEIREDGTFLYTPKKNKVGVDSFTYTAADPQGNVSRVATVTVQILKPTDARQYTDTVGMDCRFAAEWMKNTGLFVGEKVAGEECFYPEKTVSRAEFLTMLVKTLDIPTDSDAQMPADTPAWLKPYLAAAIRAGLTDGTPSKETSWQQEITGAEAAVMVQNALDLAAKDVLSLREEDPDWAAPALAVMAVNGIELSAGDALTRAEVAKMLYQVHDLSADAPGMAVLRMQK